jgi:hypothetical protein
MKIILLFILAVFPAASIACSPPAIPMTQEELTKWTEANPCPAETDIEKYNALRRQCIAKGASDVGMSYDDFVEVPPMGTKVFSKCNAEAYSNSKLPIQPNTETKVQ